VHNNEAAAEGKNVNPFATSLEQMTGEQQSISWGVFPLMDQDVLYVRSDGGGGYGDPLAREPGKIQRDVREGSVSKGVARSVYGVVLDETGEVDAAASTAEREAIRAARLNQAAAE
jgi:N-methylhydantoinase B